MPVYTYTARDRSGKLMTATMEAQSQRDVAAALRDKGCSSARSRRRRPACRWTSRCRRSWTSRTLRDVTIFSRQFATVINAGLPVVQSLNILAKQADKQGMKAALGKIREDVETGMPLSDSMAKHPGIFNKLYIYLVKAGEVSGNLDGILERVAAYFEKQQALRGKIRSAMTYPVVVLVIAMA
jgi:type IV pilus assembly protein PilC